MILFMSNVDTELLARCSATRASIVSSYRNVNARPAAAARIRHRQPQWSVNGLASAAVDRVLT